MGTSFLKQLKKDEQDLKEAFSEQEEIVANAQDTALRLEGAIVYITKLVEHIEEQRRPKEV